MGSKRKVRELEQRIEDTKQELEALKKFRRTSQRDKFMRQLIGEQSYLRRQLSKLLSAEKPETKRERQRRISQANKLRSSKMKRSWEYFRAIQSNYHPEMSLREIRTQFRKRKEGLKSSIADIAFYNPSP